MMEDFENILRRELRRCTLVFLAFPSEDEQLLRLQNKLRAIGGVLGRLPSVGERRQYLSNYLATYLVGVTYAAWNNYDDGTLWPFIEEALGNPGVSQAELAELYRGALSQLGLDQFEVKEKRHIGPILVHAGIPRCSQASFLERLIREYQKSDDLSAEDFNELIRRMDKHDVPAKGFDVPTWRFIKNAGFVADDLTEKCLEVLDDIAEDGEWDQGGGEGLPSPLLATIVEKTKEIQLSRKARRRGNSLRMAPAVWLDPSTLEIKILLPQYEELLNKPVSWRVNDGTEISNLTAHPELRGLKLRPKEVILERLTREISLSCEDYGEPWEISLFDPDVPISFFRLDGKALPDSGPLPGQEVLILAPISNNEEGLQLALNGSPVRDLIDNGPPTGWSEDLESAGWRIVRFELSGGSRISLIQNGIEIEDSVRYVGQSIPTFQIESCSVLGVEHVGQQVYSELPPIKLPAGEGGAESVWTIKVRFEAEKSSFVEYVPLSDAPTVHELNAQLTEGPFTITVEGKRGSTQRLQGYLVPALMATFSPRVRRLKSAGDGLEPCRYQLEQSGRKFAEGTLNAEVEVGIRTSAGSDLIIRPQHFEIQLRKGQEVTRHMKAVHFHPEGLLDSRLYLVSPDKKLERVIARTGSSELQTLSIKGRDSHAPFIVLSELVDTAKASGNLDLIACHEGCDSRVGIVRVEEIVSNVSIDDIGVISFDSAVDPTTLRVRGYSLDAPWKAPFDLPITKGAIYLPKLLFGFGDIGLVFDVYDAWVQVSWPESFLASSNSSIVNTSKLPDNGSPESSLARWFQDGIIRDGLEDLPAELVARLLMDDSISTVKKSREDVVELGKELASSFGQTLLPELLAQAQSLRTSGLEVLFSLDMIDESITNSPGSWRLNSAAPFLSILALAIGENANFDLLRAVGRQFFGYEMFSEDAISGLNELGILSRSELVDELARKVNDLDFLGNPDSINIAKERLGIVPSPPMHRTRLASIFLDLLAKRGNFERDPLICKFLGEDEFKTFSRSVRRILPATAKFERTVLIGATRPDSELARIGGNVSFILGLSAALAILARLGARSQKVAAEYAPLKQLHRRLFDHMPALVEYDLVVAELLASLNIESNGGI